MFHRRSSPRFIIGALSLAAYLRTRNYVLAVIGCVVLGLGIGTFGKDQFGISADMTQIGLGAGFVMLYLIPLIYERRSHWWPLIPGGVLLLLGFNAWREFREFMTNQGWPLILVIIGVLIVLGSLGGRRARGSR